MKIKKWFSSGYAVKRWLGVGVLGMVLIVFAVIELIFKRDYPMEYKLYYGFIFIVGSTFIYIALKELIKSFISLLEDGLIEVNVDSREIGSLIHEKKLLIQGPRIVIIGGGTGLSTICKGIKNYTNNITAVVTVADDGGGSGVLRDDLGMLPPGDIRNCLVALANTEPLMEELMEYRFKDGSLKGQSFGNLFLAAMDGVSENFEVAVSNMADVLAITGKVLPVTLQNVKINAKLDNGQLVVGESHIPEVSILEGAKIKELFLKPEGAVCLPAVRDEILKADAVILGPGSLYTSIIPNILVKGVSESIKESKAKKIYIANVMTQPGETDHFSVTDHLDAIYRHGDIGPIDYAFVNTKKIKDEKLKVKYHSENQYEVEADFNELKKRKIKTISGEYIVPKRNSIRHDADKLSRDLMKVVLEDSLAGNEKRVLEYLLLSEKLKKKNLDRKN
ncbi:MAG: YvcK family protein [Clostridium sp.]|nr:YvcK family protein [Clostridium sp.]